MKHLKKIGLSIIIAGTISCSNDIAAQDYSKDLKGNSSEKNIMTDNSSLVCLLTGQELVERKEVLQKEIFSQVKKVEEIETGYIFYFKYEEEFLMKMTDYVIAENNCCPFLTFEIKLHSKDDVELKIIGPSNEAKEMMKMAFIDKK